MKKMLQMVVVLGVICVLAGGLLATIDQVTKGPIEQALRAEKLRAMKKVLPPYDNDPMTCIYVAQEDGKAWTNYVARKDGKFVGAAFESSSDQGYSGTIRILVGVTPINTIQGLEILWQVETPGLGARITEPAFLDQFKEKNIETTKWKVKKDSGDIDAITGATISPRAVLNALRAGLEVYIKNQKKISATKE